MTSSLIPILVADNSVPLIVSAEDRDSNLNALLLFSIVEPEAMKYFSIDGNTGTVRATTMPDRELMSRFEFTVQVKDQGKTTPNYYKICQ